MHGSIGTALLLSTLAGLATTVGSLVGLAVTRPSRKLLAFVLGFSAGVMILVSFLELLQQSMNLLGADHPARGFLLANVAFVIGILLFLVLDLLIPHDYEIQHAAASRDPDDRLRRTGLLTAFGIALHNFPEGMVTFVGALQSRDLGIVLAVAVALHNIPEGLAISAPVYAATGSRLKAFLYSFLSGICEPVGALLAALFLAPFLTPVVLGWALAVVAGIMVAISLQELAPAARALDDSPLPTLGIALGILVMAVSLWTLR